MFDAGDQLSRIKSQNQDERLLNLIMGSHKVACKLNSSGAGKNGIFLPDEPGQYNFRRFPDSLCHRENFVQEWRRRHYVPSQY